MTNEIQHILDECKLALDEVNEKNLSEFPNVEKGIKITRLAIETSRERLNNSSASLDIIKKQSRGLINLFCEPINRTNAL